MPHITPRKDPYPEIKTEKMRNEAQRNQQDSSNLPNSDLNGMDKQVGPVKGGR